MRRPELIRLTAALVFSILALDLLWSLAVGSTGTPLYGLLDLPAHLATCAVALLFVGSLLGPRLPRRFLVAALIASVAIDFDHLPGYVGSQMLTGSLPRPYTHGLLTVVLLLALGNASRGGARQISFGLAFGVATHLFRDLGTGPGIPLLWPFSDAAAVVPYAVYAGALSLAAVAVTIRLVFARPRPVRYRHAVRPLPDVGPHVGS